MALTLYARKKLTDHLFGIAEFDMPAELWLGLHTASPGDTGSLANEVTTTGSGYDRMDLTGKMSASDLLTSLSILTSSINQGPAISDWGQIGHLSISDAQEGGNMLIYGEMSEIQTILTGQMFQRVAGQLQYRMT